MLFSLIYISILIACIIKRHNKILLRFASGVMLNQMVYLVIMIFSLMQSEYLNENDGLSIYISSLAIFSFTFYIGFKKGKNKVPKESTKIKIYKNLKIGLGDALVYCLILFEIIARNLLSNNQMAIMISIYLYYTMALLFLYLAVNTLISTALMWIKKIEI